ncbi:MAG: orotate phosphoribosyltransferase, partial [Pseudomonadota bacterium]
DFSQLGKFYAEKIIQSGIEFDSLFGPAYKGIPLATAVSIALNEQHGRSVGVTFNRKEAKTHGEAGTLIGAPLNGKIVIIDDVITAGTAIRESMSVILDAGAQPAAVVVALDRQEKGQKELSAIQEIEQSYNIPVLAIATLEDLLEFTRNSVDFSEQQKQLTAYRETYGI